MSTKKGTESKEKRETLTRQKVQDNPDLKNKVY